jgi:hypothetical protein
MPNKPSIKKVPVVKEKIVILHDCNQVEKLKQLIDNTNKLSIIITGNGDPAKGLCRQVALIGERQGSVVQKLDEIHLSLDKYHQDLDTAKDITLKVKSAFDKYEAEMIGEEKGRDKASTAGQVSFNNIISIVGTLLVVVGLVITVLIGRKEREVLDNKIDNLGTPVIINQRGEIDRLPDGDSLKYFRDGEFKEFKK